DSLVVYDLCEKAAEVRWGGANQTQMYRLWCEVFLSLQTQGGLSKSEAKFAIATLKNANNSAASRVLAQANPGNTTPIAIISRAFLLLRLASALVRRQWDLMRLQAPGGVTPWQQ